MSPALTFRPFSPEDMEALHALCVAAFTPIHDGFREALGPDIFDHQYAGWQGAYRRDLAALAAAEDGELLVVEEGRSIVGFCAVRIDRETGTGEIGLNAVSPTHQGRGIGRAMYANALALLKQKGARLAYVGTGNDAAHGPARAAYRAAGFTHAIPSVHLFKPL